MDADTLLAELEPLTHHARMRRMVALGQKIALRDPDSVAAVSAVDALWRHDNAYPRLLAVQSCYGSRDGARALAALADPSRTVRRRAARVIVVVCDDIQAATALDRLPRGKPRSAMATRLRKRGRAGVVDAFLDARFATSERIDGTVVDLIPFGSDAETSQHAKLLREASSPVAWARLARFQTPAAVHALVVALGADSLVNPRLRWRLDLVLGTLAHRAPDATLTLLRHVFERGTEPGDLLVREALAVLARQRPEETFDLLRARHERGADAHPPGAFGAVCFDRNAHRLGAERIAYLIERAWSVLPDGDEGRHWFQRLDEPARETVLRAWLARGRGSWGAFLFRYLAAGGELAAEREAAFVRWSHAARSARGTISIGLLEWLPADLRIREARRHLDDVAELAARPRERLPYAQLLPFLEARETLAPFLGHPEGEERAAALRTLIAATRFDRTRIVDAIELLRARRFEQDPVRLAMLSALSDLPLGCFTAAVLDRLGGGLAEALDAADLSHATAGAVQALVVKLFRLDGAWGARWLTKLLETRGSVSGVGLGAGLTEAEVRVLAPALAELATTWKTQERAGALIWLAASFGRRLALVGPLLDALEHLAEDQPFVTTAAAALGVLHAEARHRFDALVARLVAADPSYVYLGVVARWVSVRRQDLLGPLLADRPMTGRFATGRTRWIVDFGAGYARWTAAQQTIHARAHAAVTRDAARNVLAIGRSIETLVALAFAPAELLIALADDPRPPVREMGIRALPRLDGGEGVPTLLSCLDDDRARYAIYALRKAFAEMAPARTLALLRATPTTKVTVAKEVVRLLGELPGDEAFGDLIGLDRPGLHRDVRIAVLRGLWDHLDRPETWAAFERAVVDPDWVVASRLVDVPIARLSPDADSRLARLLARLLARTEVEARIELLGRIAGLPLRDAERALFRACLSRMGAAHRSESAAAVSAALARMWPGEVGAIVERIRELDTRRRTLVAVVDRVATRVGPYAPKPVLDVARGVLAVLAADPLALPHRIAFAGRLLGWEDLVRLLVELSTQDLLHFDALAAALAAVTSSPYAEAIEAVLASESDPRLRRLAVGCLERAAAPEQGWTAERVARLKQYRSDPSPLVAGVAAFLFPPD